MAKQSKISDQDQVTQHIKRLEPEVAKIIETLRQIILSTDKEISEHIKWNNPSFYYSGEMAEFDPKEYKRDLIVMNLHKGRIMLVFPSGAKVKNPLSILEGDFKDTRKIAVFKDLADVKAREDDLRKVIREWLKLIDK